MARAGNFNSLVVPDMAPEDYAAIVLYATAEKSALASANLR